MAYLCSDFKPEEIEILKKNFEGTKFKNLHFRKFGLVVEIEQIVTLPGRREPVFAMLPIEVSFLQPILYEIDIDKGTIQKEAIIKANAEFRIIDL